MPSSPQGPPSSKTLPPPLKRRLGADGNGNQPKVNDAASVGSQFSGDSSDTSDGGNSASTGVVGNVGSPAPSDTKRQKMNYVAENNGAHRDDAYSDQHTQGSPSSAGTSPHLVVSSSEKFIDIVSFHLVKSLTHVFLFFFFVSKSCE
jgi:hypothetical protein